MTYRDLANIMFPDIQCSISDYLVKYPSRNLPPSAIVTRYAPSPTGFVHLGALLASYTEMAFAKHSEGVFYLRIEDTDQKRTIPNGIKMLLDDLRNFKIMFDEGPTDHENAVGSYGPYIQTQRGMIYKAYVKHLIQQGKAYPCFCSEESLAKDKKKQESKKENIGYRGMWAHCRYLSVDVAFQKIQRGDPYIVRLRTEVTGDGKIVHDDLIKGRVVFPQNDLDIVILKSDGFPTYHFAHVVDDTLMRTTHVIRADEWLSSVPIHLQLFDMLELPRLKYAHIAPLMKRDGSSIRKLSKRKDPECAVSYYIEEGLPSEAVMLYLAGISNSNFEEWSKQNPTRGIDGFPISFDKISKTGAIFDLDKLMHISRNYIAQLTANELYALSLQYLKEYDRSFYEIYTRDAEYSISVLDIDRKKPTPRKDIAKYSQIKTQIWYMYDELFLAPWTDTSLVTVSLIEEYFECVYDQQHSPEEWFSALKSFAMRSGYAPKVREYTIQPEKYVGHIGHICDMLRYVATAQKQSPDLHSVLALLGKDRLVERLNLYRASCTRLCG